MSETTAPLATRFNPHLADAFCTALVMGDTEESEIIFNLKSFPRHLLNEKFADAIIANNTDLMIQLQASGHIDFDAPCRDGETFLTFALKNRLHYKGSPFKLIGGQAPNAKSVKNETIDTLLSFPEINAGQSNARNESPLLLAITPSDTRPFMLLVDRPDIDVNAGNIWGKTILMELVQQEGGGAATMLRAFLQRPEIDVNAKTNQGATAAMLIGGNTDQNILDIFLAVDGIDFAAEGAHNITALSASSGNLYYNSAVRARLDAKPQ